MALVEAGPVREFVAVRSWREGDWWVAEVIFRDVEGATQAREQDEVLGAVRDYLAIRFDMNDAEVEELTPVVLFLGTSPHTEVEEQ